jgi:CMD domain protein
VSLYTATTADVVYRILGVNDQGPIADLRNRKPEQIDELQTYYLALFEPEEASARAFPLADRYVVAVRVASHTNSVAVANWYGDLAAQAGVDDAVIARARNVSETWDDNTPLGAAIRHADLLTTRPSAAQPSDLQALKDAGYSPAGIVSLSQTIAFVSYQLRFIAGLRAFGAAS